MIFWSSTGIFIYNLHLVIAHNKKTPVEQETTAAPLFINAATAIYNRYNSLVDVHTMIIVVFYQATFEEILDRSYPSNDASQNTGTKS
jgi:hypothetical protein